MNSAIEDLEGLKKRWPGMMNIVKAINGYDVDCSYSDLVALNLQINSDEKGMEIVTRAMMKLMKDFEAGDQEVRKWFEENGFVSQRAIDVHKEMDEILEAVQSGEYYSPKEFDAMVARLLEIQEEFSKSSQRHANSIGKGLFGLRAAISE